MIAFHNGASFGGGKGASKGRLRWINFRSVAIMRLSFRRAEYANRGGAGTGSEYAARAGALFYPGGSRVAFFKKKNEESELKVGAPFEVEPKSAPPPASATAPTPGDGFATRVASVAASQSATSAEAGFDRFGKLRSALGPGTVIQGKLSFDTPVRIDGKLSGEIFSSEAIIVGAGGSIEGDIEVASLIVLGLVRGKVTAHQRVEVLSGGRLEADFAAPVFQMEDGGIFNGRASMSQAGPSVAKNGSGLTVEVTKTAPEGTQFRQGAAAQSGGVTVNR